MIFRLALFALTLLFSERLQAEIIYSNTDVDTNTGIDFNDALGSPYQEVGDQISLARSERAAQMASVQFLPIGGTGFFDATLRFYSIGTSGDSLVGAQIGGSFTVQRVEVSSANTFKNIDFALNGLVLPDAVIFTLAVSNQDPGLSLGLSLFGGPTFEETGRSDATFLVAKDSGGSFVKPDSSANLYFSLSATATAVPEPLMLPVLVVGFAATAWAKRRRILNGWNTDATSRE